MSLSRHADASDLALCRTMRNKACLYFYEQSASERLWSARFFGHTIECQLKGYFRFSDSIDYSIFAIFGFFDISYNDKIEVKKTEKKFLISFPLSFDLGRACT